jgi:DNA polymerase-4
MDLPISRDVPLVMHIDLNSCFAMIEQQANHLLRHKPVGVAAYNSPNGCVLAPSVEAKRMGVRTGTRVAEAKLLCPDIVILTPDPPKYRDVHVKFRKIFSDYSNEVTPKSIDEAVIDFRKTPELTLPDLLKIAREIKDRMKSEIGDYITCNVGISTNRFLAKTAASLHKPDGLDVITHENLTKVFATLTLLDLCGINVRYQSRLFYAGIRTPLQFLNADLETLQKVVFRSIVGRYWYERLRGYEVDAVDFTMKSIGQQYALQKPTGDRKELSRLIMKLCEKMGRRLRRRGLSAQGVAIWMHYRDGNGWHRSRKRSSEMFTTMELYKNMMQVLDERPEEKTVITLSVACYDLVHSLESQLSLFAMPEKNRLASKACDEINDRYGEFTITPGLMMGMQDTILDRVPFGSTRDIQNLYTN